MSQLITLHNNQPTVSHRVIAEGTDNQEVSIRNTINKFILDFEEFGAVHFKNETVINNGTGNQPKTYLLNEQQTTLLLTFLKNSLVVRAFKVALVKEFYKMRETLYQKEPQITITNTTDKERLGTLETQLYMMKNENRELRRAINRITYNDNHLPKPQHGLQLGEYVRTHGNKTKADVYYVSSGLVHFMDDMGQHSVKMETFVRFFEKI